MPEFMPGLDLNRLYFQQVVKPLLDEHFPGLKYSAGLLGEGSDVLGYDTPQSMDHNWGPHCRIFLTEEDFKNKKDDIDKMFRHKLPYEFMGFSTNFTKPNEKHYLVQQMKPIDKGPVNHFIEFYTIDSFFQHYLGRNPFHQITYKDWLVMPQQALLEVTGGEVYYDGLGKLNEARERFKYYPEDVWKYLYLIQWDKIANEESYMGRTGQVGDEPGSHIVASRLINNIMQLCFLIEKRYYPYVKWFGTAFSRLKCAPMLVPAITRVLHGRTWEEREEHLGQVYEVIAGMHNELKLTKPIKTEPAEFHGRPFKVIHAHYIYEDIIKKVDAPFKDLHYKLGSVDQFCSHPRINHLDYVYYEFKKIIK